MLELTLRERILKFVKEFEFVETRQIYRFFRDENKNALSHNLIHLEDDEQIYNHADKQLHSSAKKLPDALNLFRERIKAINVMCLLESKAIKWFTLDKAPWEILFVSNDGICYAVAVFTDQNWVTQFALIKRLRTRPLVKGYPDPINYIAVIPRREFIPKIRELNFTYYATLDNNGHATLFQDDGTDH